MQTGELTCLHIVTENKLDNSGKIHCSMEFLFQVMAKRSEIKDSRHIHVFWGNCWCYGTVSRGCKQKPEIDGNDDEKLLDGMYVFYPQHNNFRAGFSLRAFKRESQGLPMWSKGVLDYESGVCFKEVKATAKILIILAF